MLHLSKLTYHLSKLTYRLVVKVLGCYIPQTDLPVGGEGVGVLHLSKLTYQGVGVLHLSKLTYRLGVKVLGCYICPS